MALKLLLKEFRLCSNVQLWLFFALGPLMMLIPNYPRYVGGFYLCVNAFILFAFGSGNHDILYTASLPVKRDDIIRARFLFVGAMQILQLVLCVPVSLVVTFVFRTTNGAGIDTTVAWYGLQLMVFTVFNLIFMSNAYNRGGEKNGLSFLFASLGYWLAYAAAELPVWMGTKFGSFIDATDAESQIRQVPILLAGIAVWALGLIGSFCIARRKFRAVSL